MHPQHVDQDISMWIPEDFADNDLFEMIRDEGGDQVRVRQTKRGPIMKCDSLPYQVEKVDLMDDFTHPKTGKWDEECSFVCLHSICLGRRSKMFRVTWRDMSRTLTNEEVNAKHETVLDRRSTACQRKLDCFFSL